jgi:hypothetical protein
MHTLARVSVLAIAALLVPVAAWADDEPLSGARVTLKPGAAVRIPATRSAMITGRLNNCYLGISSAAGIQAVLEPKDDVHGVIVLPGEVITNLGGTHVRGGSFPERTCLVSMLLYAAGPLLTSAPPVKQ